ncbi:MAG: polysaccharide deacetylase family protein [Roseburia sp.]
MEEKDSAALRDQRQRRKRVARIRNGIIFTVIAWILISMILIVTLLIKVVSLEKRLDALTINSTYGQVEENQNGGANQSVNGTEASYDTESMEDNGKVPLVANTDESSNLAEAGDALKVYLTFEDGPSENTEAILDILAEYQVKATFFVVGKTDEVSQALYKRIVAEGHTLGMHSYSNKYSTIYESKEAFESDFTQLRDYLYELTGVESRYYRFPGGSSNQISNVDMSEFIQYLNSQDVVYYDWNVSSGDATSQAYSSEDIVANVTSNVVKYKTSVVLLHDADDKSTTVEALAPLIEALQQMNVEILPIDEDTTVIQSVKLSSEE